MTMSVHRLEVTRLTTTRRCVACLSWKACKKQPDQQEDTCDLFEAGGARSIAVRLGQIASGYYGAVRDAALRGSAPQCGDPSSPAYLSWKKNQALLPQHQPKDSLAYQSWHRESTAFVPQCQDKDSLDFQTWKERTLAAAPALRGPSSDEYQRWHSASVQGSPQCRDPESDEYQQWAEATRIGQEGVVCPQSRGHETKEYQEWRAATRAKSPQYQDHSTPEYQQWLSAVLNSPVGQGLSGRYASIKGGGVVWYRSSYELYYYQKLDRDPTVQSYEVEPFTLSYFFKGEVKGYTPDVLVVYTTGARLLCEIKPTVRILEDKVQAKALAGKAWAQDNNADYVFWSADTIDAKVWVKALLSLLKKNPGAFPNSWNGQQGAATDAGTLLTLLEPVLNASTQAGGVAPEARCPHPEDVSSPSPRCTPGDTGQRSV